MNGYWRRIGDALDPAGATHRRVREERDRYRFALVEIGGMTARLGGDFARVWNVARRALEEGGLDEGEGR